MALLVAAAGGQAGCARSAHERGDEGRVDLAGERPGHGRRPAGDRADGRPLERLAQLEARAETGCERVTGADRVHLDDGGRGHPEPAPACAAATP